MEVDGDFGMVDYELGEELVDKEKKKKWKKKEEK